MSVYSKMAVKIARLLASDVFSPAVLTRSSSSSFDPVIGAVTSTTTAVPCRALASTVRTKAADGALVTNTVLTLSVEPHEGDTLTMGGKSYVLGEVSSEAPDGTALIYTAVARK